MASSRECQAEQGLHRLRVLVCHLQVSKSQIPLQSLPTASSDDGAMILVRKVNEVGSNLDLQRLAEVDRTFKNRLVAVPSAEHARLILSPCGQLDNERDDVRKVAAAASAGAVAAFGWGAKQISINVEESILTTRQPADGEIYGWAGLVAELAIHQAAWVPLQAREHGMKSQLAQVIVDGGRTVERQVAAAIEAGRTLARDVGNADPERMAPPKVAEIVQAACEGTGIRVEVLSDHDTLLKEYPLLMAVSRGTNGIERHKPCVVKLFWQGEGPVERTVYIAGKGVTYDTGGADLKVGGSMAGLRMDKCGAGAAAGFVIACAKAPPEQTKGLRVVAELGCVRNSIGSNAYVADEIITGHAGKRVLVANTDAEGRMVLADLLSHLRARALAEDAPKPTFLSLATLTGHAARSYGGYAAAIDNGAARSIGGVAPRIARAGMMLGEPMEVSTLRPEDYAFVTPGNMNSPSAFGVNAGNFDVLQSNTQASAVTVRAHQFPMAMLCVASGLQEHSAGSTKPFPYCHIDLAGSIRDSRGAETGAPLIPLFGHFVLGI